MFQKLYLTLLILLVFSFSSFAESLSADGVGCLETVSRYNSKLELSRQIASDSKYISHTRHISQFTDNFLSVPLYMVSHNTEPYGIDFKDTATISELAAGAYNKKIDEIVKSINKNYDLALKQDGRGNKYKYLMRVLAEYDNLQKHKGVLAFLGKGYKKAPNFTFNQLQADINASLKTYDKLTLLKDDLNQEITRKNIYLYYPVYKGSDIVTGFGRYIHEGLSEVTTVTKQQADADYYMATEYELYGESVLINITIFNRLGESVSKHMKLLSAKVVKERLIKPALFSTEQYLKRNKQSGVFSARLNTTNGKRGMLYKNGDAVEMFVKLSKPGYFILVGNVSKAGRTYSYMVDFDNSTGDRKFIQKVDGDKVNRWLSLGEFDVFPPFGFEAFQLFAAESDLAGKLPKTYIDKETELYTIDEDIINSVKQIRGLQLWSERANITIEDTIVFTTENE
jgi:hypothetical protein